MNNDKIIRIYTRLVSLRKNAPDHYEIEEKYITEYHSIIDELSTLTDSLLDEFKVPQNEVKPRVVSGNYLTGEISYSKDNYCERTMFLSKIDALLSYFQIAYFSEKKSNIGFNSPES